LQGAVGFCETKTILEGDVVGVDLKMPAGYRAAQDPGRRRRLGRAVHETLEDETSSIPEKRLALGLLSHELAVRSICHVGNDVAGIERDAISGKRDRTGRAEQSLQYVRIREDHTVHALPCIRFVEPLHRDRGGW